MGAAKKQSVLSISQTLAHIQTEVVRFWARDGFILVGTLYRPQGELLGSILLNAGTGIPRTFYAGFAEYLATRGYGVLTYDFRGIGDSRPEKMAGFQATKRDWGALDMSAAFDRLVKEWPDTAHIVFGHSVGGQLLALMERPEDIDAIISYGSGYGYWGNIKGSYRYFVAALWYVAIPLMATLFRYVPAKSLKLGEDLPSGVATDWARWGKRPDYFTKELGDHPGFGKVRCSWKAFLAKDDNIATPENAHPLYKMYPNAKVDVETLSPQDYAVDELGHLRFFSRSSRDAWHVIPDWLEQTELQSG